MKHRFRLKRIKGIVLAAVAVFGTATAHASVSSGSSSQYYRVVAPPRETHAVGEKDFGSVAAFLTKVTGHKFVYRQPSSWLQYQNWVWRNYGAVYFDGPHFVAWRLHNQGATLGPRLPQPQDWRIFTWAGNPHIKTISDAVGSIFCAPPATELRNAMGADAVHESVRTAVHTQHQGLGQHLQGGGIASVWGRYRAQDHSQSHGPQPHADDDHPAQPALSESGV